MASSARELYMWMVRQIKSITEEQESSNQLTEILFDTIIYKCLDNESTPIVWKTTPSRMNSDKGTFMFVRIKGNILPSNSRVQEMKRTETQTSYPGKNDKKPTRDDFFAKTTQTIYGKRGNTFTMNMRLFILHLLMYDHHKRLDKTDYISSNNHNFRNSKYFKALNFSDWYRNEDAFKESIANGRRYIDNKKEEDIIMLISVIKTYRSQSFDAYQLIRNNGSHGEAIDIWKKCKNGINSDVSFEIIREYKEYLAGLDNT